MHAQHPFRRHMMSWAIRRATRVVAVSTPLRDFAVRMGATPEHVRVIPNGIDSSIFHPRDQVQCRRKWDIPADARIVLSAGSLIERKGHHRALEAVSGLLAERMPVQLLIAGGAGREDDYEKQLRRQIKDLGCEDAVRLLGPVYPAEMAELMSAADVLCLASSREGWPNVVNEALACGTPVVATAVGSVPEMLADSSLGYVVQPGDAEGLASALRIALTRRWDHTAIATAGRVRGWQHVAGDVIEEFQSMMNPRTL